MVPQWGDEKGIIRWFELSDRMRQSLFLRVIDKICQQGNFQYKFFKYVTSILLIQSLQTCHYRGGRVQLLPNKGMLIKHRTVTCGITKGVKEDFRLAVEKQVSLHGEPAHCPPPLHCINEKIIIIQSLP
ncbi:integrator complex subunit 10-like [Oncorhynchus masou masou]|uniref:integrator complex subunit 10-like n=1 Tax=Oncorhynchus masou masou TaxID=90313 RepID=UPI00318450FC